jgi:hypothetical protein
MGRKLCPKIILEGTRLTFKTDIAFALNEHARIVGPKKYRYHSPVVSAEWCGFTNFPWGRGPINFAPEEEQRAMEVYATWARLFELMPYYSWIIDRFHLSAIAHHMQARNHKYDFSWLEDRLKPLNFRIIFLTRTPDSFKEARLERLKVSGKPSQYDDLSVFVREQELIRGLVKESKLPSFELDMTGKNIAQACDAIADWMEASGGLYME